jgi:uncharacterized protein
MNRENRLISEKSPYLLQHAYNPVDWYPWGAEAFEKAEREDKPVFLSIGYSTCHWCHVMEKESFEDEEVAALLNDAFISIKVDREERPDIDGVYMTVCQMLTGSGGWPLTVVMTPDKKPFFAGTYFPKEDKYGRVGMKNLVPRIKELWLTRKEEILKSAGEITKSLQHPSGPASPGKLQEDIELKAFNEFVKRFDHTYGGFNVAPKFPTPHNYLFLMRYYKSYKEDYALELVEKSLTEMRKGGIYDQIGFGFHRYSTDPKWLVPHFEKMLYDQAQLAIAYTEAYQITKNNFYKDTAEEILTYVLRDMTSPEGGFYSAEDADSEGVEGKFYIWKEEEIRSLLKEDHALFMNIYNITSGGNWIDPVHGVEDGTNIPHLTSSFNELAEQFKMNLPTLKNLLNKQREILFNIREKRVHPLKDDKILTDWNGLMISAFAKAAQAFDNKTYAETALKAAKFILGMRKEDGKLQHRYREGEAGLTAHIEDYTFFIAGLLDLYETLFLPELLKDAIQLQNLFTEYFYDNENGGFFFTGKDSESLIVRQKELYDGALPSGNSVALMNLIRLERITADPSYGKLADHLLGAFSNSLNTTPIGFTQALLAVNFLKSSYEIIIAGEKDDAETEALIKQIHGMYIPNKIIILKDGTEIEKLAPYTKNYGKQSGKPAVYVCRNYNCKLPVSSANELINAFD